MMIELQDEYRKLEAQRKLRDAMTKIEGDMTLSFHHWAKELDIPVQELQDAWAAHSYSKKLLNE